MSANKIQLTKNDESVLFTFTDSKHYLTGNGTIEVPLNSLSLVIDSSDMVTFRKAASNDIFVSAPISDFGMSKADLEDWYAENMVGGTGGSVDPSDLSGLVATAVYVSSSHTINFENVSGDVISTIDATDFITDGMLDSVQVSGNNLLFIFNTDSGKEDIVIPLSSFFDPTLYYTKTQVDEALSGKASTAYVDSALSGKVDTTTFATYSAATEQVLSGKVDTADLEDVEEAVAQSINILAQSVSGKADTSAVTNPYLLDFWGIADESVEVTDELFEEWIDAFESGRPFYTNNNLESLSVDHPDQNNFIFYLYYDSGSDIISVMKEQDEEEEEWVYVVNYESYSSQPLIISRNTLNTSDFNEDTWGSIMDVIGNEKPILMTDDDGLYPVSVFTEDDEWMFINVRYYSTNVSCCDIMWEIHKIDDGEGNIEFEITEHITDIDSALNSGSTNPVMNSAVTAAIDAVNTSLSGKQDTLVAGSGITISGNVISAEGGSSSDPNKLDTSAFTAYSAATATALSGKADANSVVSITDYDEAQMVTSTALNNLNDRFGGMRLVKLTQAQYDALSGNTDSNTLYIITNVVNNNA